MRQPPYLAWFVPRWLAVVVALAASLLGAGAASAQNLPPSYQLVDLGPLTTPFAGSAGGCSTCASGPYFISAHTDLVFDAQSGKVWNFSSGTPVMRQFSIPAGFIAYAMNDSGTVVGSESGPGGTTIAGTWAAGKFTPMTSATETVPVRSMGQTETLTMTAANTALYDINNAGDVVGFSVPSPCSSSIPHGACGGDFAVEAKGSGGPQVLGRIPDQNIDGSTCEFEQFYASSAYAIDAAGTVFGVDCELGGAHRDVTLNGVSAPVLMPGSPPIAAGARSPTNPNAQEVNGLGHMLLGSSFYNGQTTVPTPPQLTALNDSDVSVEGTPVNVGGGPLQAVMWSPAGTTNVPLEVPASLSTFAPQISLGPIDAANDVVVTDPPAAGGPLHLALAVPGCSTGPARDRVNAHAAAAPGAACGLTVTVRVGPTQSGLSRDAFGAGFITSGPHGDRCLSGCTDLLVTVTDPSTKKPVKGASVSASVTPITHGRPGYPSGNPGTGYLCNAARPTSCGTGRIITGVHTDKKGHVSLLYWAPGLLTTETTLLTVKAKAPCPSKVCSKGEKTGEVTPNPTLTITRHRIFSHNATLSAEEARLLADWGGGHLFKFGTHAAIEAIIDKYIGRQVALEKITEEAAEVLDKRVERVSGVLDAGEVFKGLWEQKGFMSEFLDKFGLSGTGLGDPPDNRSVSAAPSNTLLSEVAGDGGPLVHMFRKGLMWDYGEQLALLQKFHKLGEQAMNLQVFEVSYCEQGVECGPGYHGRKGIHPFLYLDFHADRGPVPGETGRHPVLTYAFTIPYNADAWMQSQFGQP